MLGKELRWVELLNVWTKHADLYLLRWQVFAKCPERLVQHVFHMVFPSLVVVLDLIATIIHNIYGFVDFSTLSRL